MAPAAARSVGGALVVAWLLVVGQGRAASNAPSFAPATIAGLILLISATVLLASGSDRRSGGLALLTALALVAAGAQPDGSGPYAIEAGLVGVAVLSIPLLTMTVARGAGVTLGSAWNRRLAVGLGACLLLVAAAGALTWNPFLDPSCRRVCPDVPGLVATGPGAHLVIRGIVSSLLLVTSAALVLVSVGVLRRRPGRHRELVVVAGGGALAGTASLGAATLALARVLSVSDGLGAGRTAVLDALAWIAAGGAIAVAVGLLLVAARRATIRLRVRRLGDLVAAAPAAGTLEGAVASALADPTVRVGYWLPDGTAYVDANGDPLAIAPVGDAVVATYVERLGQPIAVVLHASEREAPGLIADLRPSVVLAMDNERLRAARLAQIRELRSSRARIVAAADAERRRVERDLHDGAQQRLLAISIELRVAREAAEQSVSPDLAPHLRSAESMALAAVEELRRLARGIYPSVLGHAGLAAALRSLSDDESVAMRIDAPGRSRQPALVEAAAYQVVVESRDALVDAGGQAMAIQLRDEPASLALDLRLDRAPSAFETLVVRLRDRVGAAGGQLRVTADGPGGTLLQVVLPCA